MRYAILQPLKLWLSIAIVIAIGAAMYFCTNDQAEMLVEGILFTVVLIGGGFILYIGTVSIYMEGKERDELQGRDWRGR